MNLLEYEAKSILQKFDIPVPSGVTFRNGDKLPSAPVVLKSQVHSGGRGKAGGIKVVKSDSDVKSATQDIFGLAIKSEKPQTILAEELLDIDRELYLSLNIDRSNTTIKLVAGRNGGVEVESQTDFIEIGLVDSNGEIVGSQLAEYFELEDKEYILSDLVENLYKCFVKSDAILLEINPLVLTSQGDLVAGDCKMTLDDDAAFRHDDWQFEQPAASANFVTLDINGEVATIANGAGLAMATVDAVHAANLTAANFLDIGGGATVDSIVASFRQLSGFPRLKAIVINIFGGIVRCDDVAKAILAARDQVENLPNLYIRLSGTNSEQAAEVLSSSGLKLHPTLADCLEDIRHA